MIQESPQNRDSLIFYRSFYEAIKELPEENQLELYNAIFELGLNFQDADLTGLSKTVFTLIKPQIEANIKRFINGKQPKVKQEKSKTEAKNKQSISKIKANNNNNVNNNNNYNENNNASDDAMLVVDYFNEVNQTTNTGAKPVLDGLNKILKEYLIDDVKLVIDFMANSWYSENGQNTLSVLAKATKFYEKLEKAQAWDRNKLDQVNYLAGIDEAIEYQLKQMALKDGK
jgi:hypothetical protein